MKSINILHRIMLIIVALVLSVSTNAQTRTTPVEVINPVEIKNPVQIDKELNIVRAEQEGAWSVGINPQSNTVKALSQTSKVQPWTTGQMLGNGGVAVATFNSAGYKEMRIVIQSGSLSAAVEAGVQVWISFRNPTGTYDTVATGNLAQIAPRTVAQSIEFTPASGIYAFTFPVMSDAVEIRVVNLSGSDVGIYNTSWVYLVN